MESKALLRGLSTVSFYAKNLEAAKEWYSELLGLSAYFEAPGYFEFRLGDYQHELGIIDKEYMPYPQKNEKPNGAIVYWHVDNLETILKKLLSMGAEEYEPITKRGEGFTTASVVDPFGNILGIMYNQHYLETLSSIQNKKLTYGNQ